MVKTYGCNQGVSFENMDDFEISELLNVYDTECMLQQGQHEFMFNFIIPTMVDVLKELKDQLIPLSHQQGAEGYMLINETNPTIDANTGEIVYDAPWDWDSFFKHLSLSGLHNSSIFHLEYPSTPPSPGYLNFQRYNLVGQDFRKECTN